VDPGPRHQYFGVGNNRMACIPEVISVVRETAPQLSTFEDRLPPAKDAIFTALPRHQLVYRAPAANAPVFRRAGTAALGVAAAERGPW
jgi:hypothetical protein